MPAGTNWLRRRAARTPERLALVADGQRLSYGALYLSAAALAARMAAAGARPGERVALWAENGEAFVLALAAIVLTGAAAVPVNTRLTDDEAAWQVTDASAVLLCAAQPLAERAAAIARALGLRHMALDVALWRGPGGAPATGAASDQPPAATAAIVYTSGTSGRPKGARITYDNLWHSAAGQALTLGATPDDRWLACLPLFHVSGLAMLTRAWLYGQAVVVHERFDPERVAASVADEGITCVSLVPTALDRLLDDGHGPALRAARLRLVLLGGGPASPGLCHRALAAGVPTAVTYGLTETASQAATLPPAELADHVGSVGRPLFWNEIRIARPDGGEAAADEVGEILVRGPTVSPGYLGGPAALAAHAGGFLHTGDLGRLDARGYLFVVDRREDLVVTGGENVYPAEVEGVLGEHPDVSEIAVVGLMDERWGQVVAAAVVPRPGARPSLDALRAFGAGRLAAYKLPRRLRLVGALARTASGKLRRAAVRDAWPAEGEGPDEARD